MPRSRAGATPRNDAIKSYGAPYMSPASSSPATSRAVSRTAPASARRPGRLVPAGTAATPPLVSMLPVLYAYAGLWAVLRQIPACRISSALAAWLGPVAGPERRSAFGGGVPHLRPAMPGTCVGRAAGWVGWSCRGGVVEVAVAHACGESVPLAGGELEHRAVG
jgi:hypothetical protein